MPYRWTDTPPSGARAHLTLWPHRSLPKGGFVFVIAATSVLILIPAIPTIGTPVFWGLLPFLIGAVAGLYAMLMRSYRDGDLTEELTLTDQLVSILRHNPKGGDQAWSANPYFVDVELHRDRGPVRNYLTLAGGHRNVELGAFLTPDERAALYDELRRLLRRA